ncbi:MAG: hypothetical protein CL623_12310 [Arcobacter sp.]|nr:hypothetical protein [Arcobacter sp.]|tara:strand:+ start:17325 stop:17528 length:204 start_codon:yes stop_codon:yes gene_type:complete
MKIIEIKLTSEELEQLTNILSYTSFNSVEDFIYDSLNDLPTISNFHEANNLLLIQNKKDAHEKESNY